MLIAERSVLLAPAEVIIQAGADNVLVLRNVVVRQPAAIRAAIELAEINMQVFRFRGPIARQRHFDAAADGPAGVGRAGAWKSRSRSADIANGKAARHIGQNAAERIAGAAAHGREPAIAGAAAGAKCRAARAAQIRPIDIALETEHGVAELPIVAGRAAGLGARKVDLGGLRLPP